MNLLGLQATYPHSRTWWNHACESRLDYIPHGGPNLEIVLQDVHEGLGHLMPCDHALVCATVQTTKVLKLPRKRHYTKCGKWQVNLQPLWMHARSCTKTLKPDSKKGVLDFV